MIFQDREVERNNLTAVDRGREGGNRMSLILVKEGLDDDEIVRQVGFRWVKGNVSWVAPGGLRVSRRVEGLLASCWSA